MPWCKRSLTRHGIDYSKASVSSLRLSALSAPVHNVENLQVHA